MQQTGRVESADRSTKKIKADTTRCGAYERQTRTALHSHIVSVGLLLTILLFSSCSSPIQSDPDWPTGPDAPLKWKLKVGYGTRNDIQTRAAVSGGLLFFTGGGSCDEVESDTYPELCLYAADEKTGQVQWQLEKRAFRGTDVVASEDTVYFGATVAGPGEGHLYAVDAKTGKQKWDRNLNEYELMSPILADGILYVATSSSTVSYGGAPYDVTLHAVRPSTGDPIWQYDTKSWDFFSYTVADGIVYLGYRAVAGDDYSRGYIEAIDAKTGQEKWDVPIASGLSGPPLVHDGLVYVPGYHSLLALDTSSGEEKWHYEDDRGAAKLAVDAATLYFQTCDPGGPEAMGPCYMVALDKESLQERWKLKTVSSFSTPIVRNGVIYFAAFHGTIYAVDTAIGAVKWQYKTGDSISAALTLADETLFVGNWWAGTMYAIPIEGPSD
jgi:outer membrane protein assembly factor BamB